MKGLGTKPNEYWVKISLIQRRGTKKTNIMDCMYTCTELFWKKIKGKNEGSDVQENVRQNLKLESHKFELNEIK